MKISQEDINAALLYLDGHPVHPGVELSIPGNVLEGMRELPDLGLAEWILAKGYKLTDAGRSSVAALKAKS
jgi:hypothetical protein